MPSDDGVDFDEVALGEEGEVFFEGGEGKCEGHFEGGLAEELAHEGVEVAGEEVLPNVSRVESPCSGARPITRDIDRAARLDNRTGGRAIEHD